MKSTKSPKSTLKPRKKIKRRAEIRATSLAQRYRDLKWLRELVEFLEQLERKPDRN